MSTLELNRMAPDVEPKRIGDIAIWHLIGFSILFFASFFNLVSLDAGKDEIKLDGQVYLKLAIIGFSGLYGILGFLSDSRVRNTVFSFPAAWVLILFLLNVIASLGAFEPANAMASSLSILCVYLLVITAATSLGKLTATKAIFWGCSLFVVGSWIAYLFVPSIGVMLEPIPGGEYVERMGGLSHPNTLGQCAGICCLLGILLYTKYQQNSWLVILMVVLSVAALFVCYSRTAIVATVAGLAVSFRHVVLRRTNFKWLLTMLIAGTLALFVASLSMDFDQVAKRYLTLLSKSGDTEEITSATGRGEIWSKSMQLIGNRPALGYGPTSSKYLLEEYSLYTHNLWLNVGLSCGIGGMLIAIIMCLARIKILFNHISPVADGLAVFIIVNGIFENIIFSNLCGFPTICWVLALSWFHFDESVN